MKHLKMKKGLRWFKYNVVQQYSGIQVPYLAFLKLMTKGNQRLETLVLQNIKVTKGLLYLLK